MRKLNPSMSASRIVPAGCSHLTAHLFFIACPTHNFPNGAYWKPNFGYLSICVTNRYAYWYFHHQLFVILRLSKYLELICLQVFFFFVSTSMDQIPALFRYTPAATHFVPFSIKCWLHFGLVFNVFVYYYAVFFSFMSSIFYSCLIVLFILRQEMYPFKILVRNLVYDSSTLVFLTHMCG